ncbi:hypothetical protein Bbelb_158640 [Branchiostoma belcheri]|nr:hypothetical protein Bbelb_158640 [Branchiostoma belcheri]
MASVAQRLERWTRNREVPGSILTVARRCALGKGTLHDFPTYTPRQRARQTTKARLGSITARRKSELNGCQGGTIELLIKEDKEGREAGTAGSRQEMDREMTALTTVCEAETKSHHGDVGRPRNDTWRVSEDHTCPWEDGRGCEGVVCGEKPP